MTKIWHITTGIYAGLFIGGVITGAVDQWLITGLGLAINIAIALWYREEEVLDHDNI